MNSCLRNAMGLYYLIHLHVETLQSLNELRYERQWIAANRHATNKSLTISYLHIHFHSADKHDVTLNGIELFDAVTFHQYYDQTGLILFNPFVDTDLVCRWTQWNEWMALVAMFENQCDRRKVCRIASWQISPRTQKIILFCV